MKKTKKEKQPVVTLYDVWKGRVTKRVILEGGEYRNMAVSDFTPNGEWYRMFSDKWVRADKIKVAYEFPDPNNVTSTSSATMTTTTSLKDLLDNEPEKPVAPKAGITLRAAVLERMHKAQDKAINDDAAWKKWMDGGG